jgi:serpin B
MWGAVYFSPMMTNSVTRQAHGDVHRFAYTARCVLGGLLLMSCARADTNLQPRAADGGPDSSASFAGQAGTRDSADAGTPFDDSRAPLARSMLAADTTPAISDDDYATFIAHLDQFGLDLAQKMASENQFTTENLVFSPLSVSYALAMTYAGARGETANEMKHVLGDSFAAGVFHAGANRLARELASRVTSRPADDGFPHRLEWRLADAIFVDKTLSLQPAFLDVLSSEYDGGVRQVDLANALEMARMTINDWVADQTKQRIINLLPLDSLDGRTRIVLVNAVYFNGTWSTGFHRGFTRPAPFHRLAGDTIQVPTMYGEPDGSYGMGADFEVTELLYEGGHVRMTIVLPGDGQFASVRGQVSAAWLQKAIGLLAPGRMEVRMPTFKFTSGSFSLLKGLQDLGMKLAFSGAADFSGISSDEALTVLDVLQKAQVGVDETGTEAAAATGVMAGLLSKPQSITVDRPFLFFIRDDDGAVLFSGQVVDPTQ